MAQWKLGGWPTYSGGPTFVLSERWVSRASTSRSFVTSAAWSQRDG